MTPDVIYDQMIGAGCVAKLIFSWGGNPGVGSLHRLRDAVEHDWPRHIEIEEYSHAGLSNAYVAGASNLPFAVLRGYAGSDLPRHNKQIRFIECPFTGEQFAAVPGVRPDLAVIHAQKADRKGNVLLWGVLGVQKEAVMAAKRSIVTVEEIVDDKGVAKRVHFAVVDRIGSLLRSGWRPPFLCARLLRTRQSVLSGLGCNRADAGGLRRLDKAPDFKYARFCGISKSVGGGGRRKSHMSFEKQFSTAEMMTVAAARMLKNHAVCFVGIGLPSTAANLARLTHAPDVVLIYESGPIGAKPNVLPLSIGDGELAETADTVVSTPEIFRYWLQGGRIDVGFLGAAQIDRFANINTTVIGDYQHPSTRLPGAGGAPEIASSAREVLIVLKQSARTFVKRLDFITSVGFLDGLTDGIDARKRLGLPGKGPVAVITDLCIMCPDSEDPEN